MCLWTVYTKQNNELDKACLPHNAAYFDSKDFAERTNSDKILKERVYKIAISLKDDGYHKGLASIIHKYFDTKTGSGPKASVNR